MVDDLRPPWRIQFDTARDPYAARNALGLTSTGGGGGGGGAPASAQYIVAASDATLTAERVATNTATITWDFSTPGQAKANAVTGSGGNVSNVGTPTLGQYAKWTTATTIQGVSPATVLSDIGAQPAGSYQPLDADLTSIAGYGGTGTWLYRSAADTWSPVTIGTGLSFTSGTLANTVSTAGLQPLDATLTALAAYNTTGLVTQTATDTFTGRSIAVPAAGISITNANGVAGNPTLALADDLAALEALAGTNTIYYRSGTSAWTAVTIGTGLSFTGGTLANTVSGGGNVSNSGTPTAGQIAQWTDATHIAGVASSSLGFALSSDFPAGAWSTWTPTVTSSSGTITSSTVNSARYTRAGKTVIASFDVTVTNAGSGGGYLQLTLPVALASGTVGSAYGTEIAAVATMAVGRITAPFAGLIQLLRYDAITLVVTNYRIIGIAIYEGA